MLFLYRPLLTICLGFGGSLYSPINEMPDCLNRVPECHTRPRKLHYSTNLFSHFRFVAMNWTLGTSWFFLMKWTLFKAFLGVIQKLLTIVTKLVSTTMQVMTVQIYHRLDGLLFPSHSWATASHNGNPLSKSRLTRFQANLLS